MTQSTATGAVRVPCLIILALATDLLTPWFISHGYLPPQLRWISHAAVAAMIVGAYFRMVFWRHIPPVVWIVPLITCVGAAVALAGGQGLTATAWGWWVMFQFPLVGLFAYLQDAWPERSASRLCQFCMCVLAFQVVFQLVQYVFGEPPGDHLAGSFGKNGTGVLVLFIAFTLCLAVGRWLAQRKWGMLAATLALGSISSVLGEMKLFLLVVLIVGILGLVLYAIQGRDLWKLVPYSVIIVSVFASFLVLYNAIVVSRQRTATPIEAYFQRRTLDRYLGRAPASRAREDRYQLGRNYALAYGWQTIRDQPLDLLFGLGLGARGESRSLNTAGLGLTRSEFGLVTGTSLLVIMQELGVTGLSLLLALLLWCCVRLFRDAHGHPQSDPTQLRYGLLLFTLLWPLWLWYNTSWVLRFPMLLYWLSLGYAMGETARWRMSAPEACEPAHERASQSVYAGGLEG